MKCTRHLRKAGGASGQKLCRVPEAKYYPSFREGRVLSPVTVMASASGVPSFRPSRHPIRRGDRAADKERQGYAADDPVMSPARRRYPEGTFCCRASYADRCLTRCSLNPADPSRLPHPGGGSRLRAGTRSRTSSRSSPRCRKGTAPTHRRCARLERSRP